MSTTAALHDAYAADYDGQAQAYACYIGDLLFGLGYEFVRPGQRLLDAGIGSGLSAQLFARAGLEVHGMDFSPAMLAICRSKEFAVALKLHDLTQAPWPYLSAHFDHLVCCGVLHFILELEGIFGEAERMLAAGGVFAFTMQNTPAGDYVVCGLFPEGVQERSTCTPVHIEAGQDRRMRYARVSLSCPSFFGERAWA